MFSQHPGPVAAKGGELVLAARVLELEQRPVDDQAKVWSLIRRALGGRRGAFRDLPNTTAPALPGGRFHVEVAC